ncbi:MAG: glycosyl transferase [Muribaculaceae bacterium]|nr:glycosyl transferase [Muribaculaceae bacterium]
MIYAPVIVFGFNRPDLLSSALESLGDCREARDSDLFVFIDGPRKNDITNEECDSMKTAQSAKIAESVTEGRFKSVTIHTSSANKGLAKSVISGVSEIIRKYGRVIVVEDDLKVLPNFLTFMNLGLEKYAADKEVYSICGYTNKVKIPQGYPYDAYFAPRSSSWGWGTWKDRWEGVDWSFDRWDSWKKERRGFCRWGGSDCFSMLEACKEGRNSSWAIRFCFNQYLNKGLSLFPAHTLVTNEGFDGSGTNCRRWSRFRYEEEDREKAEFRLPDKVEENRRIIKSALSYHGIMIRIKSKIMYQIYN